MCGKKRRVPLFPLRCSCGLQTNEDGTTVYVRAGGLGDTVYKALDWLGVHRVIKGCGRCSKRRQKLNYLGRRVTLKARQFAAWLHPR